MIIAFISKLAFTDKYRCVSMPLYGLKSLGYEESGICRPIYNKTEIWHKQSSTEV